MFEFSCAVNISSAEYQKKQVLLQIWLDLSTKGWWLMQTSTLDVAFYSPCYLWVILLWTYVCVHGLSRCIMNWVEDSDPSSPTYPVERWTGQNHSTDSLLTGIIADSFGTVGQLTIDDFEVRVLFATVNHDVAERLEQSFGIMVVLIPLDCWFWFYTVWLVLGVSLPQVNVSLYLQHCQHISLGLRLIGIFIILRHTSVVRRVDCGNAIYEGLIPSCINTVQSFLKALLSSWLKQLTLFQTNRPVPCSPPDKIET